MTGTRVYNPFTSIFELAFLNIFYEYVDTADIYRDNPSSVKTSMLSITEI